MNNDIRSERLSTATHPTLRFDLVFFDAVGLTAHRIKGEDVPFSNFVVGDLTDRAHATEDFLTRLLGMQVKIETGDE